MNSLPPEFSNAKSLIQQKRYAEARALLQMSTHPTATKWLAKLDQIDPPRQRPPSARDLPTTSQPRKAGVTPVTLICVLVIVLLAVVIVNQQRRLDFLASTVGILETDITTVRANSASQDSADNLLGRIGQLEADVADLSYVINSHASDINALASDIRSLSWDLSSVAAIAENANRWAHSHNSFSDAALKTDLAAIENPLERLLSVHGIMFTWKGDAYPELLLETGRDYGVLAQELATVFPELVSADPETGLLRVDYEGFVPVLIEALREQQEQIDELRALVDSND